MKNISYKNVNITGGFWQGKQTLNESVTVDAVYNRFYETGRVGAFKCLWREGDEKIPKPHFFWDSDVAKWIEGAAYILQKKDDLSLEEKIDEIVDDIEKNQWEDGYINSYFTAVEPEKRFSNRQHHELYCLGHLIEAAIAYSEARGKNKLLDCVKRYLDLVEKVFINERSAPFITPGHEEIEIALLKLFKYTNEKKYLDMASFFINERGKNEPGAAYGHVNFKYGQNHAPCREQTTAEGHAVRAVYLYTAMAELAGEEKDSELFDACKKIFADIVEHKMYITGGLGSSYIGETFTIPYDLPNQRAYTETCASIGMIYFCHRMMMLDKKTVYADVIERELYNGALSGLSLDGDKFFYENPLEINVKNHHRNVSCTENERLPITERLKVFGCSCCPPNLVRLLASVGDYVYSIDKKSVYVNQFMQSTAEENGIKISQTTDYPRNGRVRIEVEGAEKLYLRIPSWCRSFKINAPYTTENGWAIISSPQSVEVDFDVVPELIEANALVSNNVGRVALQYGPMVYAFEEIDNVENLHALYVDKNLEWKAEFDEYFSADVLKIKGWKKITSNTLYSPLSNNYEPFELCAIPYHAFANRGENNMVVWMKVR